VVLKGRISPNPFYVVTSRKITSVNESVADRFNHFLSENYGVSIPFPSMEMLTLAYEEAGA
jgi:hypothetical protein